MDYWNGVLFVSIITVVSLASIVMLVGRKMWKNLVVTLLISTMISFLIVCTINFIFGDHLNLPWIPDQRWHHRITLEIGLMSVLIGGVSTFIIMLGTMISKNNR
ncbi:hypothetical protein BS636_04695 [Acinetobacter sp. LoGeW2-3]|uniref:hypothetical protein n=1 Tax=Acinetobacter sp. LoGeW2-3 TaxID=1808001 RepID=UPI000C05A0C7|nr:hypothetical protein [Acinetobacter sp. LoGeW2-3]ATO19008.1 hypothetical protein BS636_04695 [Acinetobacter sp. LoGeW2-3]